MNLHHSPKTSKIRNSINKRVFTILAVALITAGLYAQAPGKISYQAIVRNSSNQLITSHNVGMQISILQGSTSGSAVYVETQTTTTNANGLISIQIGSGTVVSGTIAAINWANGPYYIKTETDPTGGTDYSITGTSQLLSVPFAIFANIADSLKGGIQESEPAFTTSVAKKISAADTIKWNSKLSSFTETDPVYGASAASNISASDITSWNSKLSSYTETDPVFTASVAKKISAADTIKWNSKLSSFTETDPVYSASAASNISASDITTWNNKLSSYTETDPVFTASVAKKISAADTTKWNSKLSSFSELDPVYGASVASKISAADTIKWNQQQTLSISHDTISLSNGGKVKLPSTLPTQTGNSGKYLTTDGSTASWTNISSGIQSFGYIYQLATIADATVVGGADVPLSNNGPLSGITHTPGITVVTVPMTGSFKIDYSVSITSGVGSAISIAVNGTVDASTNQTFLTATGSLSGSVILTLAAGDVITLRNNSAVPFTMNLAPSLGAQLTIMQIQ